MTSITWLSRGLQLSRAIARVLTLGGPGGGLLIGPDLLMTNNHVNPEEAVAESTTVQFNYQTTWAGIMEPVHQYTIDPSRFHTSEELDYTTVRVRESPGDRFGYVDLSRYANPTVNGYVCIIQHPHADPKQICLTDNKISAVFGDYVQYATDTEPGSSGSPVFNQRWEIVALHRRGGNLAGLEGQEYFTNQDVLISSLLRDAASFLGIPGVLYALAFGELRSTLVSLVSSDSPKIEPGTLALDLLRTNPGFSQLLRAWTNLNCRPDASVTACACEGGIAIGAALRQWARHGGREAVAAAGPPDPAPDPKLYRLAASVRNPDAVPADIHVRMLAGLQGTDLAGEVLCSAGTPLADPEHTFLLGVTLGAAPLEGPPDARNIPRAGR